MTWLTVAEAADLESISERAIIHRYQRGTIPVQRSSARGANGKPVVLVALESLSEAAQIRHAGLAKPPDPPSAPAPTPDAPRAVDLATLPESSRQEMLARQRAVLAVSELAASLVKAGLSVSRAQVQARRRLAAEHGTTPGTLRRWVRLHQAGGLEALAPRHGLKHRGRTRLTPDLRIYIQEQYLSNQQPRISTVYRRATAWCAEHGLAVPSEACVRRFIRSIPTGVQIYHRLGPETWRGTAMPTAARDLNATKPGEWYVGDHRICDVFVRVHRGGKWRAIRPWLSAWQDMGSRDLVGWVIGEAANSTSIAAAARMAIRIYGVPEHWYYDNGKDYRSRYLSGRGRKAPAAIPESTAGIFRGLGSQIHFATPYTPWAKSIERFFGYMPEWERTLPGWCGSTSQDRPEKLDREVAQVMTLLTLEEFSAGFGRWVETYRTREHGTLGMAPIAKWEGVVRRIPDKDALTVLLMEEGHATVQRNGIKIHGLWFTGDKLGMLYRERVTYRYDRSDAGRLLIYRAGEPFCEAINHELLRMGGTHQLLVEMRRIQKVARKGTRDYQRHTRDGLLHGLSTEAALRYAAEQSRAEIDAPRPPAPPATTPTGPIVPLLTRHNRGAAAAKRISAKRRAIPAPMPTPICDDRQAALLDEMWRRKQCDRAVDELERTELRRARQRIQDYRQMIAATQQQIANGVTHHADMLPDFARQVAAAEAECEQIERKIQATYQEWGFPLREDAADEPAAQDTQT